MRVRERVTQRIMMLDSQMVTGYRSLATNEDGFLRGYRISDSQYGTKSKSLQHLNLNITRTYRISLTKDEQETLGNSTLAIQIQQIRGEKACYPENLLAMDPLPFLPNYKSPCWYSTYQRLHCLPFFLLIGAPKSGTSDVFNILRLHPDYKYTRKEYHWLTRERFCKPTQFSITRGYTNTSSFDWYTGMVGKPLANIRGHVQHAITGDLSPSTMWQNNYWPFIDDNSLPLEPTFTTADFIYHLNNKTKIIAILRNPIDRLYSGYTFFDHTRRKGPKEFHQDVIKSIDYFTNCMEMYSVRSCVYISGSQMTAKLPVRLHVGLYYIHLLEWYRVFPRDQVLILRLEDYTQDRTNFALKIYDFLELRNLSEKEDNHFKATSNGSFHANTNKHPNYKKTLLEETRYLLYAFYKPFNQALAQLLADPGFDYGPY